ncbi:hypothetical protein DFH01_11530 [Falsiroseomonas bella]|uniref:DUF155 domain-containing protein n=1 Tax=Falsiroseomonas bella TaxID=2184016 RepID=A0A317FHF3_9PROT|nr:hypothetical protein [Falsiroseomonas bella]PWS37457.1 hypothetical protein DFH01_11530 [Falsiroseomonas bella]
MSEVRVRKGQVVALRLFDLAYEIDLPRAQALWSERDQGATARSRLSATPPKAVSFGVPPLALDLGAVEVEVGGAARSAAASVRLYDFGIAALSLRFPAQDLDWATFARLANQVDMAIGPNAATPVWTALLTRLRGVIAEALERPSRGATQEDFLIASVETLDRPMDAAALLKEVDMVPLLSGEERPLSEGARRELLRQSFSYYPDDLAVLTWDRAFILEPRGDTDVAEVLEMANAQLLELRTYDEMLDEELPRMRRMVDQTRRETRLLASRRHGRLARDLHALVAEVTELAERVDNALQVTEDVHLARIYAAAIEMLRVPAVSAAVDRKLAIIRDTYTALHADASGARAEILELAIVVMIAFEIVMSFVRH